MVQSNVQPFAVHENDLPVECWDDGAMPGVTWRTLVSGDRTPTDSITAGVCQVPVGGSVERHQHSHPEVYYFLTGTGDVVVAGVTYPVRRGSAVAIPGGAWHSIANTSDEPLSLFYCFAADSFSEVVYVYP